MNAMVHPELLAKQAIRAQTARIIAKARALFPSYQAAAPSEAFTLRGRNCGGTARGYIALEWNLNWYAADPDYYLNEIVPHEVAHIMAAATGLGRGHDAGWKRIFRMLGGSGSAKARNPILDTVPRARTVMEYLYRDDAGREGWVGPVHHKKLQEAPEVRKLRITFRSTGAVVYKRHFTGQCRKRP